VAGDAGRSRRSTWGDPNDPHPEVHKRKEQAGSAGPISWLPAGHSSPNLRSHFVEPRLMGILGFRGTCVAWAWIRMYRSRVAPAATSKSYSRINPVRRIGG